ncbi:MAG: hypothetical protein ACPGQD_03020 [Planctomycetota bacterium]
MIDWFDDALDQHPGASVPEGFATRVTAAARAEEGSPEIAVAPSPATGRILRFTSFAAAAVLLLAVGFWIGQGADPLQAPVQQPTGSDSAALDLDEIYANRELLEDFDLLSDAELELALQDSAAGTWILDVPVPGETAEGGQ